MLDLDAPFDLDTPLFGLDGETESALAALALTLRTLEQNLGAAAVAAYSAEGAPLPVPTLVIPPAGAAPVIDCGDLLLVTTTSVTSAFIGPPERCAIVMQANLAVTVTRCIPNLKPSGNVADNDELTIASLSLADDISTLFYGVTTACRNGTLWAGFLDLDCSSTHFRDARPGASGGIGWFTWAIGVDVASSLL